MVAFWRIDSETSGLRLLIGTPECTSLAFNNNDLETYIENCIIFDNDSLSMRIQRPRCLIRIDIAHLIKLVARWNCFHHESFHKKDFYLYCIGLLSTCIKLDEFIQICTDVLSITFSTHEDIDDKESHALLPIVEL